jgi:hypothetical protein
MMKKSLAANSLAAMGLALLAGLAHADGDYISPTDERVRVSAGVMRVSSSTTVRVDSTSGVRGTVITGEDQFGLDKDDFVPKFQIMVREGERNRLRLDYFTLDRTGSTTVAEPIVFRDVVLEPGDQLQSQLSLRLLTLTYGYSFWHSEKLELAATLGVTAVEVQAQGKVATQTVHLDQTEDEAGPYPTPGLDVTWVASKRFYFDGRLQYLSVHVDQLNGSLGLLELDALYRFRPNVSFAIGYTEVKAHLESTKQSDSGLFDFNTKGPEAFVRVAF